MAENQKASIMAIVEETTSGTIVVPSSAGEFIPLRAGFSAEASLEEITSDELLNDIGASESSTGKESHSGTHPIYLKHSEVEGQAPEYGLMIESCMGAKSTAAAEYNTVAGSTVSVLNVDTGEGATYEEGEAVLVKDGTNGYSIRNISSISSDALSVNFDLGTAPGTGVNLGKAVLYKPAATGHPSFSSWIYRANGGAIEAFAGCKTTSMSMSFNAGQQAETEFGWEATKVHYNPITITASNKYIDFDDSSSVADLLATLTEKTYRSPDDLAREIASTMTAASVGSGDDTISCSYSSSTGKFTISSDGSTLSLNWNTGANTANSVGTTIGFAVAADDTGALTYTADNELSFAAAFTPSYDDASNIVVKSAQLVIGSGSDTVCRNASTVSFTIDVPTVDVDDLCAESGVAEKIADSREASMTATLTMKKYETGLFDKFLNNTTTSIMLNIGPKSSGNWVPGKCVNIYMQNAKITGHTSGGDNFVTVELTAKGFVSSTKKDIFINYI